MKLRAVRLREVGCFTEPVTLEGFSGRLDVLVQPNEAGKSTVFKAVRTVLFEKHSSAKTALRALRPYGGGAPLIEIDFETVEGLFRLRKQYLSAASAELYDLGKGRIVARGDDANDQALALIGAASDKDRFGLFWVAQSKSLGNIEPDEEAGRKLASVIEREVKTVTGGRRARMVMSRAKAELERLVTPGRRQPRGEHAAALERCDTLRKKLETAEKEVAAAQALMTRLEPLRRRRDGLSDPGAQARLAAMTRSAKEALDQARESRRRADAAEQAARLAGAEWQAAQGALDEFDRRLADLGKLDSRLNDLAEEVAAKRQVAEVARQRTADLGEALAEARARKQALDDLMHRIGEAERAAAQRDERERLASELTQAEAAVGELDEAEAVLAGNRATAQMVRKIEAEARSTDLLRARLEAGAPVVTIDYEPGAEGRAWTASGLLVGGTPLRVTEPVEIVLDGIGRLTVAPGGDEDRVDDRDDLAAHETELRRALAGLGAADLAAVYRLKSEREAAESARDRARERLRILAPDGLAALKARLAAIPPSGEESQGEEPLPERSEVEAAAKQVQQAIHRLEADLATARDAVKQADVAGAVALGELRTLASQRAALETELPGHSERQPKRSVLADAAAAARAKFNDFAARAEAAKAELGAAQELAPFEHRLKRAEEAQRNAAEELRRLEKEIAGIEGELSGAFKSGAGEQLEEIKGQLAAAERRVARFAGEAAELELLIRVLEESAAAARETFLKPVTVRLRPLLQHVFPGAEVGFSDDLRPDRLIRGDTAEHFGHLSDGTQEQIAVLVRLGFARLMAEGGRPAPVILDDALVYADDERIERLFTALHMAAEHHQVIVLTCHDRSFAPLGGNRIGIEWRAF